MSERRPQKITKAIIMAAGEGTRLRPVTYHTPKPLVKVNGKPMIETVIEALIFNGIKDMIVVTGYMKEQFRYLSQKYETVRLINNPLYASCNNISSLYYARDHLGSCFIIDGDQIISDPGILSPDVYYSGYCSVYTEDFTQEWLQQAENGIVTSCSRTGGDKGFQLYGISRWTNEDGKKLRTHLEREFLNGRREIYWDDLAMFMYPDEYVLQIYPVAKGSITEIDSIEELIKADPSYSGLLSEDGKRP